MGQLATLRLVQTYCVKRTSLGCFLRMQKRTQLENSLSYCVNACDLRRSERAFTRRYLYIKFNSKPKLSVPFPILIVTIFFGIACRKTTNFFRKPFRYTDDFVERRADLGDVNRPLKLVRDLAVNPGFE